MDTTYATRPMTEPQSNYINTLKNGKVLTPDLVSRLEDFLAVPQTTVTASATITWLKAQQWAPRGVSEPTEESVVLEPGVYVLLDATIVKVKQNKAKDRVYTEAWTSFGGSRLTLAGEKVKARWSYRPELLNDVRPELRMNLQQAKEFVTLFGQCARCGRTLKAAESVERGVGPVCARWFSI